MAAALSIQDILRTTSAGSKSRGGRCQPTLRRAETQKDGTKEVLVQVRDPETTKAPHSCTFRFSKVKGELENAPVWVHCSCEHFLFSCEVADAKVGSSSVINSNGADPVVRNPSMTPCLCKHLVAAIPIALDAIAPKTRKSPKKPGLNPGRMKDIIGALRAAAPQD